MKSTLYLILLAVLLAVSLGCGKEGAEAASVAASAPLAKSEAPAESAGMTLASEKRDRNAAPVAPSQVPQRAVIRNGSLSVRVENVEKAEDKIVELVQSLGGYIDSTQSSDLATATPTLTMKIRIPSSRFDEVLDKIEAMGVRLSKAITTEDVTANIVDMAARLKIMRAQEEVFRKLLAGSRSSQEMMDVQEKLMNLRGTIESLEAQHRSLSQLAALSSVQLTLVQSAEGAVAATSDPNWAREAWGSATSTLGGAARVVGSGLIWLLVFAPLWLPAIWLVRHALKGKQRSEPTHQFDLTA